MKKTVLWLTALGMVCGFHLTASAADPASDLKKFRSYYAQRFPNVKFEDYANGLYVLPGMEQYRAQWEEVNNFPPYELGLADGKKMWDAPLKNGKTFAGCFKNGGQNIAQNYPYWDEASQKVRTAEMDLLKCMSDNDPEMADQFKDLDKNDKARTKLAGLVAAFYSLSKGQKVSIDVSTPGAKAAYEAGRKYWWQKRGQLNFACADCHWESAGKDLGGNQPLSAALGHPVAWPAYRVVWGQLETVHQRYKTCNSQVRAKPAKHGAEIYNNVQFYETYLSSGLPLSAPAMRN